MPTMTVYIKQSDVELVKKAKTELRQSLSEIFVEAIHKKMNRKLGIAGPPKPAKEARNGR